jgi:ADP-ribosylglycohydrolase
MFSRWIADDDQGPYSSFGNGSAMRVSPVGYAFNSLEEVLDEAKRSAEATHNHPEGIKGAQATAAAVFLARTGNTKQKIREYISTAFGYDLNHTVNSIQPIYHYNETCQETVPEAVVAFLDSIDFEDAIRLAISIGGDSDTLTCITGGIAHAYYKRIPGHIVEGVENLLPDEFTRIVDKFDIKYAIQ